MSDTDSFFDDIFEYSSLDASCYEGSPFDEYLAESPFVNITPKNLLKNEDGTYCYLQEGKGSNDICVKMYHNTDPPESDELVSSSLIIIGEKDDNDLINKSENNLVIESIRKISLDDICKNPIVTMKEIFQSKYDPFFLENGIFEQIETILKTIPMSKYCRKPTIIKSSVDVAFTNVYQNKVIIHNYGQEVIILVFINSILRYNSQYNFFTYPLEFISDETETVEKDGDIIPLTKGDHVTIVQMTSNFLHNGNFNLDEFIDFLNIFHDEKLFEKSDCSSILFGLTIYSGYPNGKII